MTGSEFVTALHARFGTRTASALAKKLGVSGAALSQWQSAKEMTSLRVTQALFRVAKQKVSGDAFVDRLMRKLGVDSKAELARRLGVSPANVTQWCAASSLTSLQIANAVAGAAKSASRTLANRAIRPIVEFFPLARGHAKGKTVPLFDPKHGSNRHKYLQPLKEELENHHGVYVFFDSRGRALYVGKARRTRLWGEMNGALNRARDGKVQKVRRVRHPQRNQTYADSNEVRRQIVDCEVRLHELSSYFSAYHVDDMLIDDLEALLMRSFSNDLLNKKMERFSHQRRRN